jgi:hypothetical protein
MGAIKIFKSKSDKQMAREEAEKLKRVRHPLAVRILDHGVEGVIADL